MLLFRLIDDDEEADEAARGSRGLLDVGSYGVPAALPAMTPDLTSSLAMPPTGLDDPLWSLARYGLPQPPFGQTGPRSPFPGGPFAFPSYPPMPAAPLAVGVGKRGSMWPDRSILTGMPLVSGAAPAYAPAVRGLASLLLEEDLEGDAQAAGPGMADAPAGTQDPSGDSNLVLAQAAGTPAPNRPGLDYSLDAIERNFHAIPPGWRKQGLSQAATNLQWFLDGSGQTRVIDRDEARQMGPIQRAQDSNESKAEDSLLGPYGHLRDLADLEDGQTVQFQDELKHEYGDKDFARHVANPSTRDFALAFGNTRVKSNVYLSATRTGDEIRVEGTVEHHWGDRYDFHPDKYLGLGGVGAKGAAALEQYRGAKPFAIRSSWPRRVSGTIRIENGELKRENFQWEDIEQ